MYVFVCFIIEYEGKVVAESLVIKKGEGSPTPTTTVCDHEFSIFHRISCGLRASKGETEIMPTMTLITVITIIENVPGVPFLRSL